jgi:citronellol/citronellal dehydrogenase
MNLAGRTLFITGASRGIGLAIARRAAADGANIVIAAKTSEPNPKLPGTIHTAAAEIEAAGGSALALQTDIRDEASVAAAVQAAVARFGGIDILVNNASAISLTPTPATPMKRFDLMFGVNVRGTYCCTQACLSELIKSAQAGRNPHVLNMSPPLSMREHWFKNHVAYTMAKYGMSMCTLGHAAYLILTSDAKAVTGNFFIDDHLLAERGVTDLEKYSETPGTKDFIPDFFVD